MRSEDVFNEHLRPVLAFEHIITLDKLYNTYYYNR